MMNYTYFENKITPSNEAKISISSHSLQYGTTVFGGMRGYKKGNSFRLFRMEDHFERLMNATKIIGMNFEMKFNEFKKIITELIEKNKPDGDFYIRPFVYSDDEVLTPKFNGLNFKIALYMIPLGDYLDSSKGLRLMISSYQKFSDAAISTKAKAGGTYLNSSLARTEANSRGFDEALVMDKDWKIVEGSAENIIVIYRGEAITPPVSASMLEGITWRTCIELLKKHNIPIRYEPIDRSMVYTCDELLLTGTAAQVLYAESVDDRIITNGEMGPICETLKTDFEKILNNTHSLSKAWISEFNNNN